VIFDLERVFPCQPQVYLMNQSGAPQRMVWALVPEMVTSQPLQLFVNQWKHRLQCLARRIFPLEQEFADSLGGRWNHFRASGSDTNVGDNGGRIVKSRPKFNLFPRNDIGRSNG
jgi:hypothetical protein